MNDTERRMLMVFPDVKGEAGNWIWVVIRWNDNVKAVVGEWDTYDEASNWILSQRKWVDDRTHFDIVPYFPSHKYPR